MVRKYSLRKEPMSNLAQVNGLSRICKITHAKSVTFKYFTHPEWTVYRPVRLAYKPYFFGQQTLFFSHNKSANNTFSHGLSVNRTGHMFN